MIIHDCEQNSPIWHALRCGIPTASLFDKIITKGGAASKSAEKLKFRLLAERIQGKPNDEHFSWAMERGSALEKKALQYYRFQTDYVTTPVGLVTDDEERWGASPDQFVGEDGQLEVKCPELEAHISYLMNEGMAYDEYKVQAQGQLWVTGRKWTDFLSFHPDLPWSLVRVEREEPFIEKLDKLVREFSADLERLAAKAKDNGWFRLDSVRVPRKSEQEALVDALKDSLVAMGKESK